MERERARSSEARRVEFGDRLATRQRDGHAAGGREGPTRDASRAVGHLKELLAVNGDCRYGATGEGDAD